MRRLAIALAVSAWLGAGAVWAAPLTPESAQIWKTDSATTVILLEDHRAPLVEIRLMFPAGTWSPWMRRAPGFKDLFELQMMDSRQELRARADRLGADLSLGVDGWMSLLSIGCRSPDADSAVDLARAVIENDDIDRRELRQRGIERRLQWSISEKDPQFVLQQLARRVLFRDGDPRRDYYEAPPRASSDVRTLLGMRDSLVRLPGRVIGLAGDLTRAQADRLVTRLLPSPLPGAVAAARPVLPPPTPEAERARERTARIPGLTQAYIGFARAAPGLGDSDYPAFAIANHVLGGYDESRLYRSLRREAGDVYGTWTSSIVEPGANAYVAWTSTRSANAATVEGKLRDVLTTLSAQGITEQERADAVGYMRGQQLFNEQYPGKVLDRMLRDRSRGLAADYRTSLLEREAAMPLSEVNAFARRFCDPGNFTVVRVEAR